MGKIKIHEISKKIGIANKELIEKANKLNIEVKSHLSAVTEEEAELIINSLKNINNSKIVEDKPLKKEIEEKSTSKSKKEKPSAPVIIRREVIIDDAEKTEKEEAEKKKQIERQNNIGFVKRDQNKDYNIVYRNKVAKPLTVDELFGLNKKEEPQQIEKKVEEKNIEMDKGESKNMIEETIVEDIKNNDEQNRNNMEDSKDNKFQKTDRNNYRENNQNNNFQNRNNNNYRENNQNNNFQNRNNNNYRENNPNNNFQNRNNNNFRENNSNNNFQNRNNNNFRENNPNSNFQNRNNNNFRENNTNSNFQNRNNNNFRENNTNSNFQNQNNNSFRENNQNNNNFQNRNNNGYRGNNNQNNNFQNRNNNGYRGNNQNNNQNGFNKLKRPLDEKGIEKNIKNILTSDVIEKEQVREYNKDIDKKKSIRNEEVKNKKVAKTRKNDNFNISEEKLKSLKQEKSLSNMYQNGGMFDYYDLSNSRSKRNRKKNRQEQSESKQKIFKLTEITIPETISVKNLATELKKTSSEVIKKLISYGIIANINNELDFDTAFLVAGEFGITAIKKEIVNDEDILFDDSEDREEDLKPRPPVIVVMGHVDHGKTSLLDAIRSTNVIEGEAGGITQHIGAYQVNINGREITFLDTPGHEAFTSMRARGAQITDIAILVVAADDGVMPQTIEAIDHAKSAGIPIIVAVNKIDLPGANIEKIKQDLMRYELVPEEWGGDTIYVPISAKKHENIDQLLEMVILVADVQGYKANPNKQAKGVVIEARLDKSKGPIATMLVQRGTLDLGDTIVVGSSIGRIRAMKNDRGQKVKKASLSMPVEIMGLTEVPTAGDTFYEVKNEKIAKHLIERRKRQERENNMNSTSKVTLDDLFNQIEKGDLKQLNLIVKADVQGTVEAVKQSLEKLTNEEVKVKVIRAAAGAVTESDISLAKVSNAIIIAFNVRPTANASDIAQKDEVEIKQYSIIYKAIEDVEAAMTGMLEPKFEEKLIGKVEVRQVFKVSNIGTIAGGYVILGKVERNAKVRVIREDIVIHEGKLASLKRFKDDAKEVAKGYECGLQIENFNNLKESDIIEVSIMEEIKR